MRFGDNFWTGAGGATAVVGIIGRAAYKVRGKVSLRREATKRRNILIDGAPAVDHLSPRIIGMAERLETIERVQSAQGSQLQTMAYTLERLEKKFDGNGGDTMVTGDVIQRIAKKLGVWEP